MEILNGEELAMGSMEEMSESEADENGLIELKKETSSNFEIGDVTIKQKKDEASPLQNDEALKVNSVDLLLSSVNDHSYNNRVNVSCVKGDEELDTGNSASLTDVMPDNKVNEISAIFACGFNRKPRSNRSKSGVKKSTWGSAELLQSLSQKCLPRSSSKKPRESRRSRSTKKRKHNDMAYEGDLEWEALLGGPDDKDASGKHRLKGSIGSMLFSQVRALEGESAAVAVGLRARAAGPAEKIRFKDNLKKRGGLQEYIECRNFILGLWERYAGHVLSLADCGVSETASSGETARASYIREIYNFLNYHGYINIGIASHKPRPRLELQNAITRGAKPSEGNSREITIAEADEEAAYILGQIRGVEGDTNVMASSVCHNSEIVGPPSVQCQKGGVEYQEQGIKSAESISGMMETIPMEIDECPLPQDAGSKKSVSSCSKATSKCSDTKWSEGESLSNLKSEITDDATDHPLDSVEIKATSQLEEFSEFDSAKVLHGLRLSDSIPYNEDGKATIQDKQGRRKKVIVIGAGPAGLAAARHLQRMNIDAVILEARERVGGRVFTDRSTFAGPVDLGASIITGVEADVATERRPDPSALLCKQLNLELTTLRGDCPLYDSVTGSKVLLEMDEALEAEYNSFLDDTVMLVAHKGDAAMRMSLEEGLEQALMQRRGPMKSSKRHKECGFGVVGANIAKDKSTNKEDCLPLVTKDENVSDIIENEGTDRGEEQLTSTICEDSESTKRMSSKKQNCLVGGGNLKRESGTQQAALSQLERRIMDWHFANLEYGCAAELKNVSLPYWNQDDIYGGFGGPHCMIKGGYGTVMEALAEGLDIKLGQIISKVEYATKETKPSGEMKEIKVWSEKGEEFIGDAVLVTVPLGCLKANTIKFSPPLPEWKTASIHRLGFGVLNKVVMQFPATFWDESVDYFGATAEDTEQRGRCFMFWNLTRTVGAPVLIALVVGKAAVEDEEGRGCDSVAHALKILRKLFGESAVPEPVASVVTKWGSDPFSRGAYSYVAVGASGEDYDILGRPVENCVFFAGEGTCKEHPDTVGGAIMSGLREAIRIIDVFEGRADSTAEAEAMAVDHKQSDSERNEVRDMVKRLSAAEISNAIWKEGGNLESNQEPLSRAALLHDMFGSAKTSVGRLLLAKEMLQLPSSSVKSFAGTKDGLTILNRWILDSMGKDGTQLLRHCVRLLLVVATNLVSIRQSGIGRTIKEKVYMHTSRDIRSVAGQLVKMWVEVFRKEKASNGVSKPANQGNNPVIRKTKPKEITSGKAITPVEHAATTDSKPGVSMSNGVCSPSNLSNQRVKQELNAATLASEPHDDTCKISNKLENSEDEKDEQIISEEELAALAAAEIAKVAAVAATQDFLRKNSQIVLPKIPSFHNFAIRDQFMPSEKSKRRKPAHPEQKLLCKSSLLCSGVQRKEKPRHEMPEKAREERPIHDKCCLQTDAKSIESAVDSNCDGNGILTDFFLKKQETDIGKIDLIHREPLGNCPPSSVDSMNKMRSLPKPSQMNAPLLDGTPDCNDSSRGSMTLKKAVSEFITELLLPLYKTKRIQKDGFKSIAKKATVKVMERCTEQEISMEASLFLDKKRKLKIRDLVDQYVERHLNNT